MIEGPALPEPGTEIVLKRGSLQTSAVIVWTAGRRAGVSCRSTLFVPDWMSKQESPHQQGVDALIRDLKSRLGQEPNTEPCVANEVDIAAELRSMRDALSALGDSLVSDVVVVATHPEIQILDISLQRIERILSALAR